jgi:hypothetical protein
MFYFVHILAGAVIARYFPSLWPIIILSILFHFILDIIPHKDNLMQDKLTKNNYYVIIPRKLVVFELAEIWVTILLMIYIIIKFPSTLVAVGIFFSLLPDAVKIFYLTDLKHNKYFKKYIIFHSEIQTDIGWFWGLATQIITAIILIILLL